MRNHLAAVGDLWLALESTPDYAAAERLAIEFGEDFRLMADLGWNPEDGREWVELTMEPDDLTEVIRRLRDEAISGLGDDDGERGSLEAARAASEAKRSSCGSWSTTSASPRPRSPSSSQRARRSGASGPAGW